MWLQRDTLLFRWVLLVYGYSLFEVRMSDQIHEDVRKERTRRWRSHLPQRLSPCRRTHSESHPRRVWAIMTMNDKKPDNPESLDAPGSGALADSGRCEMVNP